MPKTQKKQILSLFGDLETSKKVVATPPPSPTISLRQNSHFTSTKDALSQYQIKEQNKHIAYEFQSFGCHLAETLADKRHTSLYIKLAKTIPRGLLERALSFVIDSTADNKAKLFMWKLEQLKQNL